MQRPVTRTVAPSGGAEQELDRHGEFTGAVDNVRYTARREIVDSLAKIVAVEVRSLAIANACTPPT